MKKIFAGIFIAIILLNQTTVMAVDYGFYSANDILFYDPSDTECSSGTSSDSVSLSKDDATLEQIFQLLINNGFNAVQASAIMGNMYAESSFVSDRHEEGNDIGYGLAQWSFGRRDKLEAYAASKNVDVSDVALQIDFLTKEYNDSYKSYLTVFNSTTDITKATENWMIKFEAPKMSPASDPARLYSKRIPAAEKIYGFYKDLAPGSPTATNSCVPGNGAVVGDIVNTALNYALKTPATEGMNQINDATVAYQQAIKKYSPNADITDCGGFVGTVMISSKVDEKYPPVGVQAQYSYVTNNPDKYQILTRIPVSDLQPGDILITLHTVVNTQHTTIFTGKSPYPSVDASYGGRVPSVRDASSATWMLENGAIVARIIK